MKGVQCYELFGGIARKNHAFSFSSAIKADKTIADAIYDLQLTAADAPCVIAGDFNHCDLRKVIPSLKQYVSFPTRKNSTIDLCYGNIPHAYKSYPLPPIGNSDHDTVKLTPLYRPKIRTACIIKKTKKSGHMKTSTN